MEPNRIEWQKRCTFNGFCKAVLRNEAIDAIRERKYRKKHEVTFSDLSPQEENQLYTCDQYFVNDEAEKSFFVAGKEITAKQLADALHSLPEEKRQAVLLYYFFDMKDAASIAVIGAADGPTAIFVANTLKSQYLGAIMVAAYSYMALVPIVQPPVIRLLTTQKERRIRMPYEKGNVTQLTKILFPVVVTVVAGLVAPASVALVGFLMFGNLLRECGVLNSLSETAQNVLANLITLLLGLTVAGQMTADKFVRPDTLLIMALGLVAFIFDTAGGVLFAKLLNLFLPEGKKLNPMIGAAGISAFPMSGRVVNKMGLAEDNQNFLLMYSISVNVSGQIASVLAGGLILSLMA